MDVINFFHMCNVYWISVTYSLYYMFVIHFGSHPDLIFQLNHLKNQLFHEIEQFEHMYDLLRHVILVSIIISYSTNSFSGVMVYFSNQ